jgi:uncharacterized protein YrzB (UPF0473 family)
MMVNYKLSVEAYRILKKIDFSEIKEYLVLHDEECSFSIEESKLRIMKAIINEEIVGEGMDNQNTVNSYGIKLYELYDEILDQIEA